MAQTNYTPIILYNSGTTTNAPSASNLANGELAINYADGKLFYKDGSSAIQVIGWKTTPTTAGGTGLTSYTAGDLPYYASGSALSKLGIGTSGYVLESNGSAPTWVAQSTLSVGTATNATNTAITDNTSSSATWYPTIVSATTGNLPQTTSSTKLSFVPSTGVLSANGVALTGNLGTVTSVSGTGTVSGISLTGTVTSTGNLTLGGSLDLSSPPAIGGTTPNTAAFNVLHGKSYAQTSTSSPYSIVDTSIYSNTATVGYGLGAIYDVYVGGDPYATGSTSYYSTIAGLIFISYGYNGSSYGNYISYTQLGINAIPAFPAQLVVTAVFWNGTTESTFTTSPTTNQIRIKVTYQDTGNIGYNQTVYLTKRL